MLSEGLKKTAIKEICFGRVEQEVDFREMTSSYEQLRTLVMMYGYRKRVDNAKPVDNSGVDIGELAERLKQEIKRSEGFKTEHGWGKGSSPEPTKLNNEPAQMDPIAELCMLLKGKGGKGNGGWGECWTCGSPDHQQWNCPKGKGKFGGFKGKGKLGKGIKGGDGSKGGKGKGCFNCGDLWHLSLIHI